MKISYQQYYTWLNKIDCKHSLMKLRRKKYPHQLSDKEIGVVKEYVTNDDFIRWSLSSIYCQMLRETKSFMSMSSHDLCKFTEEKCEVWI